jgi:hypothetical protein
MPGQVPDAIAWIGLPVIDHDGRRVRWAQRLPAGCRRAGWGEWAGDMVEVLKDVTRAARWALPVYGRCAGIGWMQGPRPATATVRS